MTTGAWLAIALLGWIGIGVVLAMALGRRGFDSFSWFLIGVVLGPMAIPIAWNCIRRDEMLHPIFLRTAAPADPNGVSVLIGVDGSPECLATIETVQRTFRGRLGRVALATVVPFEGPGAEELAAKAHLEGIGQALSMAPDLVLLQGHPATALAQEARLGAFDLIAVGATGHGQAHRFGSTAKELTRTSPVPVFIAGQHVAADDTERAVAS